FIGAIPAMIFLAIFMMPFYYGSKARSVPEYLKLRFDEKTRGFNAFAFAIMTVFSSGISMYALALLATVIMPLQIDWNIMGLHIGEFDFYLMVSAVIVLVYMVLGGLTSAIYNEVLQFFLIVVGFAPLVFIGLKEIGGWEGIKANIPENMMHSWKFTGSADANPLGVEWFAVIIGLGFVLSFGYWTTNFLVVQRAMAAGSMSAARKTPLIGALPKMFLPALVVIPGMIALALSNMGELDIPLKAGTNVQDFDKVIPVLLMRYMPMGVLGLGITALMASFMSGMAGNVSAFNTVFTFDIYQAYIRPDKSDKHYLKVGRWTTVVGVLVSILTAYVARSFNNVMDFLQLIFAFVNAPLFAAFLLGMFWKRTTGHAAFWGLIGGTISAAVHHGFTLPAGGSVGIKGGFFGLVNTYPSEMAQNFWTAIYAFSTALILTFVITLLTKKLKTDEDLKGLVYSLTPRIKDDSKHWYQKPEVMAVVIGAIAIVLSIIFW
ncbi:MAG: Na+/galactose cotransporter, partial [Bacteroidetes bacterium]